MVPMVNLWNRIFLLQIDWTEKWLIALVMFHFTCFFLIIVTRKSGLLQAIIFITLRKYPYMYYPT